MRVAIFNLIESFKTIVKAFFGGGGGRGLVYKCLFLTNYLIYEQSKVFV